MIMKKILLALLLIPIFAFTQESNLYDIPDPSFLTWIQENHPNVIVNDSLSIDAAAEINGYFGIQYTNITNLDGLQYFSSLSDLDVYGNYYLEVLPDLSDLINLSYLSIYNNSSLICIGGYPEPLPEYFGTDSSVPICMVGCMDSEALNFDYFASIDDGSCDYNENFEVNPQSTTILVPSQFTSIQTAINTANKGDTILVGPGTYHENIIIHKDVVLMSVGGSEETIIQGNGTESCVRIDLLEVAALYETISNYLMDSLGITELWELEMGIMEGNPSFIIDSINSVLQTNVVLDGFTLTGGGGSSVSSNSYRFGGGIIIIENNSLTIQNCNITENTSWMAGGVYVESNSNVILLKSIFSSNTASTGEGNAIYSKGNLFIENCLFYDNGFISNENNPQQQASLGLMGFTDINHSTIDGVMFNYGKILGVSNSIIREVYGQGSYVNNINNCINFAQTLFSENYHLSESSVCIGAAILDENTPSYDIVGNPRPNPNGTNPDIGAYEHPLSEPQIETYPIDEGFLLYLSEYYPSCIYNDSLNVGVAQTITELYLWSEVDCNFSFH